MSCHQLIYQSRPAVPVTKQVLLDILNTSQLQNYKLRISGLLVFHNGAFMQLLEGGEKEVHDLYAKIQRDPRHADLQLLLDASAADRLMPTWVMGFSMSGNVDSAISDQDFHIPLTDVKELCQNIEGRVGRIFRKFLHV